MRLFSHSSPRMVWPVTSLLVVGRFIVGLLVVGLLVVGLLVVSLMAAGNAHAMQTGEEVSAPGGSESSEVTIFQLEHIDAQEALKILLPLMEGSSSRATLVPQSNRIALVGSHSELVTFTELLRKLDSDQRKPVDPLVGKPAAVMS